MIHRQFSCVISELREKLFSTLLCVTHQVADTAEALLGVKMLVSSFFLFAFKEENSLNGLNVFLIYEKGELAVQSHTHARPLRTDCGLTDLTILRSMKPVSEVKVADYILG